MAASAAAPSSPHDGTTSALKKFEAQSNDILRLVEQLSHSRWALHVARMKIEAVEKLKLKMYDWTTTAELDMYRLEVEMHKKAISSIIECIDHCASERIDV